MLVVRFKLTWQQEGEHVGVTAPVGDSSAEREDELRHKSPLFRFLDKAFSNGVEARGIEVGAARLSNSTNDSAYRRTSARQSMLSVYSCSGGASTSPCRPYQLV